ncbi:RING-H2 finger protein [Melia azedarach]|uniref:RING-H2 finger protein n=1 Tax=Melia azedarach TaxID=155640 RepID=A0ACC1XML1_MELAZ|nr:RING-H2 finger protein [Melia azedarach]
MATVFFFILFASSMYVNAQASVVNCPPVKCGHDTADIHFPFWVKGQQSQHCGYPGFELVCKENTTLIHFPSYGDLVVKSISYDTKKLDLLDPKNCVHGVFLYLNLSGSPFRYYYVLKNYTYLNCSARLPPSFTEVPCLSGPGHHFYTVESSLAVPSSCRAVKSKAIPFAYSPYIADNAFGLGFTWDLPGCGDCKAIGIGGRKSFLSKAEFLKIAEDEAGLL